MNRFRRLLNYIVIVCLLNAASITFAEEINTQKNEPSPSVKEAWTVVVFPDTQHYVSPKNMEARRKHPILDRMMDWIVEQRDKRNIQLVVHIGDVTNSNNEEQWALIRSSYRKLDNAVPYLLCVGNHDENRKKKKEAKINDFFQIDDSTICSPSRCALPTRHDKNVGRIRQVVEDLGLAENTLIMWTSDNGDQGSYYNRTRTFDGNGPFRKQKGSLYEGGIRVPLIAW